MRIALITCATLPDLDPDDRLLLEPLRTLGVQVVATVWDAAVDWASFDLAVIRSTWDYPARRTEFLDWARRVPRLANPADVIEWNTDKRYLAELAAAGVPVVPTTWLSPDGAFELPASGRHVLKPSVGAGSVDAAAFSLHDERERLNASEHAARLAALGQTVMVQPYLSHDRTARRDRPRSSLAKFSHAIVKGAMLVGDKRNGGWWPVSRGGRCGARTHALKNWQSRAALSPPSPEDPSGSRTPASTLFLTQTATRS